MPEWSKGVALRSTVLRTRGFEPRFSLLFFLLMFLFVAARNANMSLHHLDDTVAPTLP